MHSKDDSLVGLAEEETVGILAGSNGVFSSTGDEVFLSGDSDTGGEGAGWVAEETSNVLGFLGSNL